MLLLCVVVIFRNWQIRLLDGLIRGGSSNFYWLVKSNNSFLWWHMSRVIRKHFPPDKYWYMVSETAFPAFLSITKISHKISYMKCPISYMKWTFSYMKWKFSYVKWQFSYMKFKFKYVKWQFHIWNFHIWNQITYEIFNWYMKSSIHI